MANSWMLRKPFLRMDQTREEEAAAEVVANAETTTGAILVRFTINLMQQSVIKAQHLANMLM